MTPQEQPAGPQEGALTALRALAPGERELQAFLHLLDEVMAAEGVPGSTRNRIFSRAIFGRPEGPRAGPGDPARPFTAPPFHAFRQMDTPAGHEPGPGRDAPWFGRDGREVPSRPAPPAGAYPLTSTCAGACGRMILLEGSTAQWQHCD